MTIRTFEGAANRLNNRIALDFIKFYKCEFNNLKCDPVADLMFGKRNIAIHRKPASLHGEFYVHMFESVRLRESLNVRKIHKNEHIEQIPQSSGSQQQKQNDENISSSKVESKWFFTGYSNKELTDICRDFLDLIRAFVDKTYKKFP